MHWSVRVGWVFWNRQPFHEMWTVGGVEAESEENGPSPALMFLCFTRGLPGEDFTKPLLRYHSHNHAVSWHLVSS